MTKTVKTIIICDTCNKDISPHITGYPAVYILEVSVRNIAKHLINSAVYSVMIHPPIEDDLHFCDLHCMTSYGAKTKVFS